MNICASSQQHPSEKTMPMLSEVWSSEKMSGLSEKGKILCHGVK